MIARSGRGVSETPVALLGDPVAQPRDVLVRRSRVDDEPEEIVAEEIDDEVVEHRAVGLEQARIERLAGHLQLVDVVGEHVAQERARALAFDVDDAHVRDVEHARVAAHRAVLVDLGAVVDRHVPAAEIHHARAGRAVHGVEGCLFRHAGLRSGRSMRAKRPSPRPVCPFYLRDWGTRNCLGAPSCPFGGSPPPRGATALQMRIASAQS